MPFNTEIYPSAYSNLCPGSQVEEGDRLLDLENQILNLRQQMLLNARRAGVGLAELQNQTLFSQGETLRSDATSQPPPPPIVQPITITKLIAAPVPARPPFVGRGFCYIGAGNLSAKHGQVDKFVFLGEVRTAVRWDLLTARFRHTGVSSPAKGYWLGGQTGPSKANNRSSNIEAVGFATESRQAVSATLTATMVYSRGTENANRGYIGGNYSANSGLVNKITFSNESVAALGSSLSSTVGGCNAYSGTSFGFFTSGWNNSRVIERIAYSNDAISSTGAQISIVRIRAGNFASSLKGYLAGGYGGGQHTKTAESFRFSNNGVAVLAKQISFAQSDLEGFNNVRRGYVFGGTARGQLIECLRYNSEHWVGVRARLSAGGRYTVPVGRP